MTTLNVEKKGTKLVVNSKQSSSKNGTKLVLQNNQPATIISSPIQQTISTKEKEIQIIEVGIQGPQGPPGSSSGGSAGVVYEVEIPSGQTRVIESFDEDLLMRRWEVSIEDETLGLMSYQIRGSVSDPGNVFDWVKYSLLGTRLSHQTLFNFNLNLITYSISNTGAETLYVRAIAY